MKTNATTSAQAATLPDLAHRANQEHAACEKAIQSALEHAKLCGDALLQAKELVGHGLFATWIANNCKFGDRQARRYMTIANGWEAILDLSKRTRASDLPLDSLSVREALRMLSAGGPEDMQPQYLDKTCPSCGERLVISSKFFATCPACWNCRLYVIQPGTVAHGPRPRGAQGTLHAWHNIRDPNVKADVIVHLLAGLDAETVRWLKTAMQGTRTVERTAGERLVELAQAVATETFAARGISNE
jgi:hypothetical protein